MAGAWSNKFTQSVKSDVRVRVHSWVVEGGCRRCVAEIFRQWHRGSVGSKGRREPWKAVVDALRCDAASLDVEGAQTRAMRLFGLVGGGCSPALSEHVGVDSAMLYWQYPCCGAETGRGCAPEVGECEGTKSMRVSG